MGKIGKSALALLLAGVMAFMPVGESLAAENVGTNNDMAAVAEIIETETETPESDSTETEEATTEIEEATTETEEATTETEEATTETEETTTETEETTTETEETTTETEENGVAKMEESTPETEEPETEESEFPGINSALSSVQMEDMRELATHLSEIENIKEGKDCAAGELVFLADTREEAEKIAAAYGGELARYNEGVGVVALPEGKSVVSAVKAAVSSDSVILPPAWPNYIYKTCSETEAIDTVEIEDDVYTDTAVYTQAAMGYNDPLLQQTNSNYQWQHAMVGSASAWNAGYTGEGIKIAILDTGVNAQTDLNIVANYNKTKSDSYTDKDGHGTHVAGLAAAKANNGVFGAGIAPEADVINIKVLGDDGIGYDDGIMSGINKAVSEGADIINLSLGGYRYNGLYAKVVKDAYNAGVAVFAAASNDGSKAKAYPAAYDGAIAIGAVQQNKGRTYFSNYGAWVKFSAPGWNLPSLPTSGDTPAVMSGTSQATPIAAGTAAVILSADESIKAQSGSKRVDALIKKMNKGKISGSGGAAGIVSLPKALNIPISTAAPSAPVFEIQSGTRFAAAEADITIKAKSAADKIYYSTNGKAPTYKNGMLANATEYTGTIKIGGSAKITVQAIAINSCGKVSKAAKAVYTLEPSVSTITITGQSVLLKGKSTTLKATAAPSYAKNKAVNWTSSDGNEVTVNKNGKVTATSKAQEGKTYTITATAKDGSETKATIDITVKAAAAISKVSFTKKSDTVVRGGSDANYNLAEILKVDNADKSTGTAADVTWTSSNSKLATVNQSGEVAAKLPGKVTIKATAKDGSGKQASFTLTIKQQITEISISGLSKVSNGKSIKLISMLNDGIKEKAPSEKKVQWAVSPAEQGVTIDQKGTLKAAKNAQAGTYSVVATAADGSGASSQPYTVTVEDNAISKIQFEGKAATIFRTKGNYNSNNSVVLNAKVTAKTAAGTETSSEAVEFSSSNPGVAAVSSQKGTTATIMATGNVTGTTTITCKATDGSGKKATFKVTVINPASKLTVTAPAGNAGYVGTGKKIQLSAVFEEELGSVSNKKVAWSSSDETVATVDKNGKVTGIKDGKTAVITAAALDGSGMTAKYTIEVRAAIRRLRLSAGIMEIDPNRYYIMLDGGKGGTRFWLTYNGSFGDGETNNVYPRVAVEIANPDIVSASWGETADEIVLWANKNGKTKVTFKALDGSGTKVTYEVRVSGIYE